MCTLYHREQSWLQFRGPLGGGGGMYVPCLNFKYSHLIFWGVGHVTVWVCVNFTLKGPYHRGPENLTNQRLDSGVLTFKSFMLWHAKIEFQGLSRDCQHIFEWYCNQLKNKFLTTLFFLLLWIENLSDYSYSDGQGILLCTLFNICWTKAAICY